MPSPVKHLRRLIVFVIGVVVLVIGLILIPLPGPGILISFAGLFILATEFEWAAKHRDRAKNELHKIVQKSKQKQKK